MNKQTNILTFTEGREQQVVDQSSPGVVTDDGHPGRVAPEGADVLPDPGQAHGYVVDGEVAAVERIGRLRNRLSPQKPCKMVDNSSKYMYACNFSFAAQIENLPRIPRR